MNRHGWWLLGASVVVGACGSPSLDGILADGPAAVDAGTTGDGNFVVFRVPADEKQSAQFLGTLGRTGAATLVP